MQTDHYLTLFQKVLDDFNLKPFTQNELELKVGVWLNSVALKIQKASWRNNDAVPFQSSVFFSIWVNDESLSQNKFHYNIHALKLRELSAYRLKSRDFAEGFRKQFKSFEDEWPNVSTGFGPLTLMEGWVGINDVDLESQIQNLARKLLNIHFIIDDLLEAAKR